MKNNKHKEIVNCILEYGMKYQDSINVIFALKDFVGYKVTFEANEKDSFSDTYEKTEFNFMPKAS